MEAQVPEANALNAQGHRRVRPSDGFDRLEHTLRTIPVMPINGISRTIFFKLQRLSPIHAEIGSPTMCPVHDCAAVGHAPVAVSRSRTRRSSPLWREQQFLHLAAWLERGLWPPAEGTLAVPIGC